MFFALVSTVTEDMRCHFQEEASEATECFLHGSFFSPCENNPLSPSKMQIHSQPMLGKGVRNETFVAEKSLRAWGICIMPKFSLIWSTALIF